VHGFAADVDGIEREEIELTLGVVVDAGLDGWLSRPLEGFHD